MSRDGRNVRESEVAARSSVSARRACLQARKILCVHYLEKVTARLAIATSYSGFPDSKRHQPPQNWLDRNRKSASVMDNRLSQLPSLFLASPLFADPPGNRQCSPLNTLAGSDVRHTSAATARVDAAMPNGARSFAVQRLAGGQVGFRFRTAR